jgi:hypothetical protein
VRDEALDSLLVSACELLRAECLRSFESAWDWAAPRMRTNEEARLVVATLTVLQSCQALLVPHRLLEGALASLHVIGARSMAGEPLRRHLFVYVTPDGFPPPGAEPDSLCFRASEARDAPFRCAARILGDLLHALGD